MNRRFASFLALALFCIAMLAPAQTWTQNDPTHRPEPMYRKSPKKKDMRFRAVHGIVKDEHDNPVKGALVNLKNLKTKRTLTFITKQDGRYNFDGLSREEDYELSATFHAKTTPVKKISQFDPQMDSMRILSFAEPETPTTASAKPGK
jgi:hypothetical protein